MNLAEIVDEFLKGCSNGIPGECQECLDGFVSAARQAAKAHEDSIEPFFKPEHKLLVKGNLSLTFDDEELYEHFVSNQLDGVEADRQMMIRGLAVQSLCYPGFEYANREIAKKLQGEELFDEFRELLGHSFDAFDHWGTDLGKELGHE